MQKKTFLPAAIGVGYMPEHFDAILTTANKPAFLEIHAENYMVDGGWPHRQLSALRRDHALSIHGVALSLGGTADLDREHLQRLKLLCDRYQPESFSEHLAWSSHDGVCFNELLPVPYTEARLARVAAHIDETQNALGRSLLIENPATYVDYAASPIPEWEFLAELVKRTGCGLLLDVNNVYVCAHNHGFDARAYLARFPLAVVEEIHLAGHDEAVDADTNSFLIDSHGTPISDPVFALYAEVLEATGPLPTLIERDNNIPGWPEFEVEILAASRILDAVRSGPTRKSVRAA
jgi:uncharacterized protein